VTKRYESKSNTHAAKGKRAAKALTLTLAAAVAAPLLSSGITTAEVSANGLSPADSGEQTESVFNALPQTTSPVVQALDKLNSASTASELQSTLEAAELALNLTAYNALSEQDRAAAAEALLSSGVPLADSAAVQEALNRAVAAQRDAAVLRDALVAVNSSGDSTQLQRALESPYLGLVMLHYRKLTPEQKQAVAEAVRAEAPAGGFPSRAALQQALNNAIVSLA